MQRLSICTLVIALYALHQDFWFWRAAAPFVFGFLPIGLFYHLCYTLAVTLLMWLLIKRAWPAQLESDAPIDTPQSAIRNPHSEESAQ